tara:strand:+ start:14288 stop:14593 length:306 start_codon:yes stop_codon:yes gene_type:complete
MSWENIIKKGNWPMGTPSEQKKKLGYVMFDEFGRDADERGEFSETPDERKKEDLLDYIEDIEIRTRKIKRYLDKDNLERAKRLFQMIMEESGDAIEVIDEK